MIVDDEFDDFMRRCFPTVKQHDVQWNTSRQVWFAATNCLLAFMLCDLTEVSENEALRKMDDLTCQMKEFLEEHKTRHEIT